MVRIEELLLSTLLNSSHSMRLSELRQAINKEIGKKELNSLLYSLQERGLASRTVENPPLWSATVAAASTVVLENNVENASDEEIGFTLTKEEGRLVKILMEHGKDHGMSTGSIAAFLGKSIALTNRILYRLENNAQVIRRSRSNPPIWKILTGSSRSMEPEDSSSSNERSSSSSFESESRQDSCQQGVKRPARIRPIDAIVDSQNSDKPKGTHRKLDLDDRASSKANNRTTVNNLQNIACQQEIKETLSKKHNPDDLGNEAQWVKRCGEAVWRRYRKLNADARGSDIVAGFIVSKHDTPRETLDAPRVVAIGSGTKAVAGDRITCDGTVVHDSHAEVVARRCLIRWLYSQLQKAGNSDSVAVHNLTRSGKPFRLRSFKLWFYTSQTPCGDSAVYSLQKAERTLCWETKHAGSFRMKIEARQGTVLDLDSIIQTIDGLRLGDRVMHHSCSDKMAKWSVLGVQGSLLSRLIDPIYITGVIIGRVFSQGHICRAICCRSEYALKLSNAILQEPFEVKHPLIRHLPLDLPRCEQIRKKGKLSYNWAEQDFNIEAVNGMTGRLEDGQKSRICKKALFAAFSTIERSALPNMYSEEKALAIPYQTSKKTWKDCMLMASFGTWRDKPSEVDEFRLR